jgi:glycosyltransferase involved in cell wall biosynthesis
VIPNPLPPDLHQQALTELDEKSATTDLNVLTMSRLVAGKGTDIAIRAVAEVTDGLRLVIAGDGDQKESLMTLARGLHVEDRVQFVGWVTGDEKRELLRQADVFCLPSTYDVFPMSVVEAFAFGVPVVASRWGGIPDLVKDGQIGVLTEPGSASDVASALKRLSPPALRKEMGNKAKRQMLDLCASDRVGVRLKEILDQLAP